MAARMSEVEGEGSVEASGVVCVLVDMVAAGDLVGKMAAEEEGRAMPV